MIAIQPVEDVQETYSGDFAETSLKLPSGMGFEAWDELGLKLVRINKACEWWLVDWLLYGMARFGELAPSARAIASAFDGEAWQLAPRTVENYLSVGRAFPPERRLRGLGISIYQAVQGVQNRQKQEEILEEAAARQLSLRDVRKLSRRYKHRLPGRPTEARTLQAQLEDINSESQLLYMSLCNLIDEVADKTGLDVQELLEEEDDEWPALVAAQALINDLPGYGDG